jgi:YVTN family beta-propeller protein
VLASESFPTRVKFTPDGRYVLVSNMTSNEVAVFDAATRQEVHRIPMIEDVVDDTAGRMSESYEGAAPAGILIHPNNRFAFISNTRADVVSVIDLNRWYVVTRLKSGREPDGMAFSKLSL